jgi:Ankyrin repeats (3 copies)/SAM domain (Sterile alpha motif)/Ankyrin repeat
MEVSPKQEEIFAACRIGDTSLIKNFLNEYPEDINLCDKKLGWTLLHMTIMCGHMLASQLLLQLGADPNAQNYHGKTPLLVAVDEDQAKLAKLLLRNNSNPNITEKSNFYADGEAAIHLSVIKNNEKIVNLLLKFNADCNLQNSVTGKTPLHYAIESKNVKILKILLKANANPLIKDFSGKSGSDIAEPDIKNILKRPFRSNSNKSTLNSPLFLSSPDTLEAIPSISVESFNTLNLSILSSPSPKFEVTSNKCILITNPVIDPDADSRPSKAFSFGRSGLMQWLEIVGLEFLYEPLMIGGYDDIEQIVYQMKTALPINQEMLGSIGITKPGHQKRLLAALEEEARPLKSSGRVHRHRQSNPLKCCIKTFAANSVLTSMPGLEDWLESMNLKCYHMLFVKSGYDNLDHMLALMNTHWQITENVLKTEIGIYKQTHRNKILNRLKINCLGFETMKKAPFTARDKTDGILIENHKSFVVCDGCLIV